VVRIIPFNHPFMFCAGKPASALAAGNAVIVKPPEQAPLSALRIAELTGDLFPPGVFSVVTGDGATGAALASHPGVAKVALIGSVNAGRAVMRAGADHIRPVLLELGGKNALIAFADAGPTATGCSVTSPGARPRARGWWPAAERRPGPGWPAVASSSRRSSPT
jgi:betaine-aldehyde dehydrogenase